MYSASDRNWSSMNDNLLQKSDRKSVRPDTERKEIYERRIGKMKQRN
jgi:hypothetical protein